MNLKIKAKVQGGFIKTSNWYLIGFAVSAIMSVVFAYFVGHSIFYLDVIQYGFLLITMTIYSIYCHHNWLRLQGEEG